MLTAKTPYCPSQEDLADFAAGTVTAERLETLSAHIDTCVVCQATIAELSDSADSFVATLRTSQGVIEEESACRQALEQMLNQRGRVAASPKPSVSLPEFVGPYRVLEPIAAGGMGMVLRAQHPKLKRTVAIKLLPLQQWAGSTAVARFEREMEVIGNLDHPNIVRASDAGDAGGMHYLVMDFIDGTDLSQLVHRLGPLPVADACEIARQTAIGLQYVHDAGLVHRDIKPSNIMLTGDGRVKILDLGLAMLNEQFSEDANNLTTVGQLMGTLDYMSPEQAADSRQVDARADIYSLGATLFKLLTGQAPYGGPNHRSLLKKVLALASGPVPSVRAIRADVPIELDQIVQRCLDKNIESRFTQVAEVAEALAPLAATAQLSTLAHEAAQRAHRDPAETPSWNWVPQAVDQPSESPAQEAKPLPKPAKPRKLIAAIVGVATLALLIAVGVLIRIATDRGELIVRSDDPHAQIRITRVADHSVEDIAVEKGERRTVVKSGEYTVELLGDGDEWTLSPTRFTMNRGGQKVLQVQRVPLPSESSDAAGLMGSSGMGMPGSGMGSGSAGMGGMPGGSGGGSGLLGGATGRMDSPSAMMQPARTYDGRSYEQWMQLLEVDRSPVTLLEAIHAIEILMPKGHDERVARMLLQVMRDYGSFSSDSRPQGQLIEATESLLFKLDPGSVARAILAELPNVNERDATYLARYFAIGFANLSGSGTSEEWRVAMTAAAPQIASRVLELSRDDTDSIVANHGARLLVAVSLTLQAKLDVTAVPGFLAHCHEALRSQSVIEAFSAAMFLAYFEPDADGLVETLGRMVGHSEWGIHAAGVLCQLGTRAQTAVPSICDMLLTSKDYQEIVNLSGGLVQISRALGDPECDSAIAYLEKAREQVSPAKRDLVDQLVSRIRRVKIPTGIMPGGEGMMPAAGRGSMVTGMMLGTRPGMMPGMMPGAGSMMPGSGLPGGTGPGEGSLTPGPGSAGSGASSTIGFHADERLNIYRDGAGSAGSGASGSMGSGSSLPGITWPNAGGLVPGYSVPGVMPGTLPPGGPGGAYPGAGGSMMPGSGGSLLPGSNLPSTTVPGEGAAPPDAENQETPGTSDGTSQAPTNTLPGGLSGSGAGLPGALPGGTGVFNGGIDTKEKYDGKSFEEWMAILETERSPDRLVEVFEAIQVVRPKGEDERVARAILRCMRDWERPQADGPNRKYMYGARSLIQFLDPVSVLQVIRAEIPHLNNRQANFLSLYFHTGFGESSDYAIPPSVTRNRWCRIVKDGAPTLVVEALEQSRRTDDSVDTTAMLVIAETLSTLAGLDVTKIDGFLPRFREALRSNDDRAVLAAASVMVIHEPDTEGLAEIVGRFLENDADRGRACQLLLRLGPRAEPVVSRLIDQLLHTQDPPDQYRLASTVALLLDDTVTSAMEAAARESSVESAVSRLALVRQLAKQLSPVEPYGTIPEWNRTQDTTTPTEAAPPQESDNSTPNAESAAPDHGPPNGAAPGPESPVTDPSQTPSPGPSDTDVKKSDEAEAGGGSNTPSPSAGKDSQ